MQDAEIGVETPHRHAAALVNSPETIVSLERLISDRLGAKARHVGGSVARGNRGTDSPKIRFDRSYSRHVFSVSDPIRADVPLRLVKDGKLHIFVKTSPRKACAELEADLNSIDRRGFRTAFFFGDTKIGSRHLAAWEHVPFTLVEFSDLPPAKLRKLVVAAAGISSMSGALGVAAAGRHAPPQPYWLRQIADQTPPDGHAAGKAAGIRHVPAQPYWLRKIADRIPPEGRKENYALLPSLTRQQRDIVATLASIEASTLAHNDFNPKNVYVPDDGDPIVIDWEACSLSAPGADLCFLANWPDFALVDSLLGQYCERLSAFGVTTDIRSVRIAIETIEGFRCIKSGWQEKDWPLLDSGIALLNKHRTAEPILTTAQQALRTKVEAWIAERGTLYAPIPHPAFSDLPCRFGPERFEMIAPHLRGRSVLDIGSHWGYMSHRLEDAGYEVTACEHGRGNLSFLNDIRDLCGKRFTVQARSVFRLPEPDFDIVFALNVFHQYLKKSSKFAALNAFLARLKCRQMIYQGHQENESLMKNAEVKMTAPQMAEHLARALGLPQVVSLGTFRNREIFSLTAR